MDPFSKTADAIACVPLSLLITAAIWMSSVDIACTGVRDESKALRFFPGGSDLGGRPTGLGGDVTRSALAPPASEAAELTRAGPLGNEDS